MTVKIQCAMCGIVFEAKSSRALTCSSRCRLRKSRGSSPDPTPTVLNVGNLKVIPTPELPKEWQTPPTGLQKASEEPENELGGCEKTVLAELELYDRVGTVRGQIALALARRVDETKAVMGFAALTKELDRALVAALAGVDVQADPIDEIRRRRDEKLAQ